MFILSNNFLMCYASSKDDFDYGVGMADNCGFNETATISITNSKARSSEILFTTIDYVPVFNRTILVPAKKNVSALIKAFCNFWSGEYDSSALYLNTICEKDSDYNLTLVEGNNSLSAKSELGEVNIFNIPPGEISAYISNNNDHELSCNTFLFGYGLDTTPEEGFNISLKCYDKNENNGKTNMWWWLGILSLLLI